MSQSTPSKHLTWSLRIAAGLICARPHIAWGQMAAESSQVLEEIVVTANKRSESIQDVAGQVTAVTAVDLEQIHANSFADFAGTVPGVSIASGGPTNNLIAIRGVTTGAQLGSAVALYLDDVPLGSSTQFGAGAQAFNVSVFDLDRVEVLNGPQGTLYGANALGGTVKYVTAAPDETAASAIIETEGSHTEHGSDSDALRLMVNLPLFDDRAALRVTGFDEYDAGYAQDPTHDRQDVGSGRPSGGRVAFAALLAPNLDIRLSASSQRITAEGSDAVFRSFLTHDPTAGTYDQSFGLAEPAISSLDVYSGVLNWDLHWAKLTSITGAQHDYARAIADTSVGDDALLHVPIPFRSFAEASTKKFTQEVRLASPSNKSFEWVAGGYFTHEITSEHIAVSDAASANGTFFGIVPFNATLPSSYRELAGFADATYYFVPAFDVTLGVRYGTQNQSYQSVGQSVLFPNPLAIVRYQATSEQGVATYLINPSYHLTENSMIYVRASSGFRPGGPNFVLPGPSALPPTFNADKLWNYELGEKSTLLGGRATLDLDVYDIEWHDIQLTDNVDGINQLVNAGDARVRGAESSFSYLVVPKLTIYGSASYTDAFLTTTSPPLGIRFTGARLPLSPRVNFSVGGNYSFAVAEHYSTVVSIRDTYLGDRDSGYPGPTATTGNPLYRLGAYNTLDLNASLSMPHGVQLDLYLKNAFDSRGEVSASTGTNEIDAAAPVPVFLSQPRTVGLVLRLKLGQ